LKKNIPVVVNGSVEERLSIILNTIKGEIE
jgi:hypothetical protein